MATYFTGDFADFATDWTKRWDTSPSTDWAVSGGDLTVTCTTTDTYCALTWNDIDADADRDDAEILTKFRVSSVGTNSFMFVLRGSGSGGSETCYMCRFGSGTWRVYKLVSGTTTSLASATVTLAASTDYWLRFRVNTDDLVATIWADGGSEGSPISSLTVTNDTSITGTGWVGAMFDPGGTYTLTVYQFGVGTNGDVAPSAGGAFTLACASGTYTISGTAASLKAGRKLAADSGAYALSGTSAALTSGRRLTAGSGSYSIAGTDVAPKAGRALNADSGAYSIGGTAAALRAGRSLSADSGAYAVSGSDAALIYAPAGAYTLSADAGTYTISGTAVSLKVGRKLSTDAGAIAISGSDVALTHGYKLTAVGGEYIVGGSAADLRRSFRIAADSGAYVMAGTTVTLGVGGVDQPLTPGIEYTLPAGRMHYTLPVGRAHYTLH